MTLLPLSFSLFLLFDFSTGDRCVNEQRDCVFGPKDCALPGSYRGSKNTTRTGLKCQWLDRSQFCRNPNGTKDRPWCFTTFSSSGYSWDYCFFQCTLPKCGQGYFLKGYDCISCPRGSRCLNNEAIICSGRSFQDEEGQAVCKNCQEGLVSAPDGTSCVKGCVDGYFLKADSCQPCPVGFSCNNSTARPCPPGTFQDHLAQGRCKTCSSPGYHQPEAGSIDCIPCPTGHFCDPSIVSAFKCHPGTYQPMLGQQGCRLCENGEYQDEEGSVQCKSCPLGHKCLAGSSSPAPCPAGTYQGQSGRSYCISCPKGQYQTGEGMRWCLACPTRHYCPTPEQFPLPCPNDHFQDQRGQAECKQCPKASKEECLKKQGWCLVGSALNGATGGAWTAVEVGLDAAQLGKEVLENRPRLRRHVTGTHRSIQLNSASKIPLINALYNLSRELIHDVSSLSDKEDSQDPSEIEEIAYQSAKVVRDAIDLLSARDNRKWWNKVEYWYKEIKAKVASNLGVRRTRSKRSSKSWSLWGLVKYAAKKLPVLCNVIEGFSEECRLVWGMNEAYCRRSRRSVHPSQQRLQEFLVLMTPVQNYLRNNPDIFFFLASADDACRNVFDSSWSREAGDKSELISQLELTQIEKACANYSLPGIFNAQSIAQKFNDSFSLARKGFLNPKFVQDLSKASTALPESFFTYETIGESVGKEIAWSLDELLKGIRIVPTVMEALDQHHFLVRAKLPTDYEGWVLVELELPVKDGTACRIQGVRTIPTEERAQVWKNEAEGSLFILAEVKGKKLWFMMLCKFE